MTTRTIEDAQKYKVFDDAFDQVVKDPAILAIPCVLVEKRDFKKAYELGRTMIDMARRLNSGPKLGCHGLAANQIGHNMRVIVVRINRKYKAFVNPNIVFTNGITEHEEGCFSFPGQFTKVKRSTKVVFKASNVVGSKTVQGLDAFALQHEIDHLNGVLI